MTPICDAAGVALGLAWCRWGPRLRWRAALLLVAAEIAALVLLALAVHVSLTQDHPPTAAIAPHPEPPVMSSKQSTTFRTTKEPARSLDVAPDPGILAQLGAAGARAGCGHAGHRHRVDRAKF